MKSWRAGGLLLALALPLRAEVHAPDYREFWLWAGVSPPADTLRQARALYLLQGEVSGRGPRAQLSPQGVQPVPLAAPEVWLAWRVQRLDWADNVLPLMLNRLQRWRRLGTAVTGLQIDFDARTRQLAGYAGFLRQLKAQLPPDCRLSITGLLDWTQTGDVATLNGLRGIVDEIVVQTYRGRHTEPEHARYLQSLTGLTLPFKIGLVQGGDWDARWQAQLARNPQYRGEVVFLLNPR